MRELKRIFLNPLHIGILLFFSLLSGFFFYYQQLERFPAPKQTGILYQKILEEYSSLTLIEAQQKAEEASGMYQALSLLLAVRDKDEYNRIRDNYESRYPELITQLESGNWNESNTASLLSAHEYLSEQIAYLNRYADYRKQIDENAENLQSSGLFSQPGTFRYENILKTKKDYQSMDASWLSIHPILAANAYQDSSGFFAICGIAYLAVFCFLLFEERRNHMWESIYASGNGRTKLIWIRITALSIGTFLFSFFTHSIRLSVSILLYGGLEPTALVQEIAAYQECPYPISIGFCFLIQFLLQWFGLLIFGIAIAGICAWCANQSLAYVGIAVFLTIEYLLFSNLSDASSLAWLKYNNIFLSLHPKLLFAKYLNLPFGSVPVALTLIYGLFSGVLIVFGLSLFAFGLKWKRPSNPFQPWERLCMNLRKRFPMALRTGRPVFTEISKALLWRKGMAVLFLYGLTAYSLIRPVSLYENGKESALNFYYSETEGIFDAAVMDRYLTQAQAWINEGIQVTEDAFERLQNKEIGELEYTRTVLPWEALPGRIEALEEFRAEMEDLKEIKSRGNTAYVVNPFGYRWLLSNASVRQKIILTILQVLAIGLIQFLMVTYDKRSNMTELLYSTAKGRHVLHRRKTMAGGLPVILLWIVEWTALIQIVMRSGGSFHFANASLSNLSFTKALPEFLSIGLFLGILAVLHLILLLFIMQISSFLFRRLSKIN